MKRIAVLAVAFAVSAVPSTGQEKESPIDVVSGAYSFRTHCASCHGTDGKGEGPLTDNLRFRSPDLTRITQRNQGAFPADKIQRIVDGRSPLKGHGGPEMPIWGDAFKGPETGYDEEVVKAKIRAVVDYLRTIQEK
jgi:mono/diheme cytochrome c family protein